MVQHLPQLMTFGHPNRQQSGRLLPSRWTPFLRVKIVPLVTTATAIKSDIALKAEKFDMIRMNTMDKRV
ncbi:Protein of unknown function [Gryllus bimaculatus]|nr:Protein of unknown function [Gryllus bimaculatus]